MDARSALSSALDQPRSPARVAPRPGGTPTRYAARENLQIVDVFADFASGLSVQKRKDFSRLLATVQRGASFEAVLVRDVSRWGRFQNIDESAYWEFFWLLHGVRVIYAEETFDDAPRPYDSLLKALKRLTAAEFSREKGRLVQAALASTATRGYRIGSAPYGMTRIVVDSEGKVLKVLHKGERKDTWSGYLKLAPSHDQSARVVRTIFRMFTRDQASVVAIAAHLNRQKVPSPTGKIWSMDTIREMLKNPAYAGIGRARFHPSPNFVMLVSKTSVPLPQQFKLHVLSAPKTTGTVLMELSSVSRHPGIAMNAPRFGADTNPDLYFSVGGASVTVPFSSSTGNTVVTLIVNDYAAYGTLKSPSRQGRRPSSCQL
jgi:DNA invertase Pin-like site-specific DNA recombinase